MPVQSVPASAELPAASAAGQEATVGRKPARRSRDDLLLLGLAILVLVVPAWLRSLPGGNLHVEDRAVAPLRIRVNSAPWHHFLLLEGIGEVRARTIVEHRQLRGPFRSLEDLLAIPRMPSGWVEQARPYLELDLP